MVSQRATYYTLYANAVKKVDELEKQQLIALKGWLDAGQEIPGEEAARQKAIWEALRKATNEAEAAAETLLAQHLKPYQDAVDTYEDDAFNRGKYIAKYKSARQKLWDEERKMENAVLVMRGKKPLKLDRRSYHRDFD